MSAPTLLARRRHVAFEHALRADRVAAEVAHELALVRRALVRHPPLRTVS